MLVRHIERQQAIRVEAEDDAERSAPLHTLPDSRCGCMPHAAATAQSEARRSGAHHSPVQGCTSHPHAGQGELTIMVAAHRASPCCSRPATPQMTSLPVYMLPSITPGHLPHAAATARSEARRPGPHHSSVQGRAGHSHVAQGEHTKSTVSLLTKVPQLLQVSAQHTCTCCQARCGRLTDAAGPAQFEARKPGAHHGPVQGRAGHSHVGQGEHT